MQDEQENVNTAESASENTGTSGNESGSADTNTETAEQGPVDTANEAGSMTSADAPAASSTFSGDTFQTEFQGHNQEHEAMERAEDVAEELEVNNVDGTLRTAEGRVAYAPPGSTDAANNGVQQDASGHFESANHVHSHQSGTRA